MANKTTRFNKIFSGRLGRGEKGMKIVTPQLAGRIFGSVQTEGSWGEKNDGYWMESGPPWIQSGSGENLYRDPDDFVYDFGGIMKNELLVKLAKEGVTILKGSNEEKRWRLLVPKAKVDVIKKAAKDNKASFLKAVNMK